MDFVFEVCIEILFEVFGEAFILLAKAFFPQKVSAKAQKIIKIASAIIGVLILLMLFVGLIILFETSLNSSLGWILVAILVVYVFSGIVLLIKR